MSYLYWIGGIVVFLLISKPIRPFAYMIFYRIFESESSLLLLLAWIWPITLTILLAYIILWGIFLFIQFLFSPSASTTTNLSQKGSKVGAYLKKILSE
jgi:hypothetical protein